MAPQTHRVQTHRELLRGTAAAAPHPSCRRPARASPSPCLLVPGGATSLGCSLQSQAVSRGLRILRHSHQTPFLTFLPQRAHCPHLVGPPSSFPRASPVLSAPTPGPSPPLSRRGPGSGNSPSCLRAQGGCALLSPARVFGLGLCVHLGHRCCRETFSHSAVVTRAGTVEPVALILGP